jgi:5-methylcytosine-specific restriction endonuclease McrA
MPRKWNEKDLVSVVPLCYSIDGVIRTLGLKLTGGNRKTVKRWIEHLSLDTTHFNGRSHRKGSTKPVIVKKPLNLILVENSTYTNTHRLKLRLISEGVFKPICRCCCLSEWMGKPIPLELNHINGTSNDHQITNLELLCPNCHAQTGTYRALNIKKLRV